MGSSSIAVLISPMALTIGSSFFCFFFKGNFRDRNSLTGLLWSSPTVPSSSVVSVLSTALAFHDDSSTANSGKQASHVFTNCAANWPR